MTAGVAPPSYRRFDSIAGRHILIVPHSRIYDLPPAWLGPDDALVPEAVGAVEALALPVEGEVSLDAVPLPIPHSISLNVSSSCNLACSYCYAGRGKFEGRQAGSMPWAVAQAAVDRVLHNAAEGERFTIGFIGGEPFVNRHLIKRVVEYAERRAMDTGATIEFSVTTNGTLLEEEDRALLREHPFAVTVSVDGAKTTHESQRPAATGGRNSWDELVARVSPLLNRPGKARICARATVSRQDMEIQRNFDAITAVGFAEVGFSPLRRAVASGLAFEDRDWPIYTASMSALAKNELRNALSGAQIRFTNFVVALRQIHRGWAAPYACGAAGGYFSVATDGQWYACHRAIGDAEYRLGDNDGLDANARQHFLAARHVHAQTDCRGCWARYLCSGGCHQERSARSIASCDFVRSWLTMCMTSYCELLEQRPEWFST